VGDWIVAIGNPFGLGGSATTGIVSARGRDIQSGPFDDFLQIDAPINRGNSGGPLFDLNGKVVGVNTAIFSPNGGNIGIGFAIPSAQVEDIVTELRAKGRVERGWLGVNVQGIDQDMASGLGLDSARGALVANVVDGSPAADAGVMAGDVILGIDGKELSDVRELVRTVGDSDPGDSVDLEIWRMGETEHLNARLAQADDNAGAPVMTEEHEADHSSLGLAVQELDSNMRRRLRLGDDVNGVVVRSVGRDSVAAERGLRPGDVIVGVGQMPVDSVTQFNDAVGQVTDSGRDAVVLQVLRDGVRTFVALPLR
jgi:serine protease Do